VLLFGELLQQLHDRHRGEFVRRMRKQGIPKPTWSTWIHRPSVPRSDKRKAVFQALDGLAEQSEIEASLAWSDRYIAMKGGYAGELDRAQLIEDCVGQLARSLAQLREPGGNAARIATTLIYNFMSNPLAINAVSADPPDVNGASKVYKRLVQSRAYYGAILADVVPGLRPAHYEEIFRLVVRLCAGSVHEVFRPWNPERRLLSRVVSGPTGHRSDEDEIDEIHRAVLATARDLAVRARSLVEQQGHSVAFAAGGPM
jgi:hypothetical protein